MEIYPTILWPGDGIETINPTSGGFLGILRVYTVHLDLRRWEKTMLEFISYHAPFKFWLKTLNYHPVRVESFLGTAKKEIWCQDPIRDTGRHDCKSLKHCGCHLNASYTYSFSLQNDPLPVSVTCFFPKAPDSTATNERECSLDTYHAYVVIGFLMGGVQLRVPKEDRGTWSKH